MDINLNTSEIWAVYINPYDEQVFISTLEDYRNAIISMYNYRTTLIIPTHEPYDIWVSVYVDFEHSVSYRVNQYGNIISKFPRSTNGILNPSRSNIVVSNGMFELLKIPL